MRTLVKITLGWERAYVFELWILDHNAGVDVVLGTDFMIPTGVRLDLFQANTKLPDEVMTPLIKTMSMLDGPEVPQTEEGPTESMAIPGREWREFKLRRNKPPTTTHELWIRRTEKLIPSVTKFHKGRPTRVRLTNLTDRLVLCPTHLAIVAWVPIGTLPKQVGYVRLDSKKYSEWQVLAYEAVRDKTLFRRERELYEEWLAAQPPAVDRPSYTRPKQILRRYLDNSDSDSGGTIADEEAEDSSVDEDLAGSHEVHEGIVSVAISGHPTVGEVTTAHSGNATSKARGTVHKAVVSEAMTNSEPPGCSPGVPIAVATTIEASPDNSIDVLEQTFVLIPAETKLNYTADNVRNPELEAEQQASLIAVLKNHDKIMIASGNALPPPAYGVVCDIDVGGHAPIKQRACRIPLRHLKKLYELLKRLLKAGLIAFSDSPWASPIVIVLMKNGLDIRLCIAYKLVNAVTLIMEYAMPLVDGLLTDLEAYLWFCSLDAASGFWAIMMTMRARKISAFVFPLGHFEWLRRPFGLKNAPMIYQRMIDNALWGFVQPKGGWRVFADRMQAAEERAHKSRQLRNEASMHWSPTPQNVRTKFDAAHEDSVSADPVSQLINNPDADMFTTSEADTSTLVPVFDRRSFVDDICFVSPDEPVAISVMTRYQKKSRRKRVRFADVRPSGSNEDLAEYDRHPDNSSEEAQAPPDNGTILTSPDNSNEESQTLPTIPNADDIDPVPVQNERHRRIAKAQEEELKWASLKAVLRGNSAKLGYKAARDAWKVMDQFVLSEDEVLYYKGTSRRKRTDEQAEIALRLVVPTTMIQEVLQNCPDSLEGGHQGVVRTYQRVKMDYFWIGLYADVEKHVRACPDCSSSKSRPHLRGHSPGNILAELPFQLMSMDFVIPLPTTRRGNSALLLFQCSFTGFVIAKAMSNTDALRVAQAFEECVYRRFGDPSLIRHDRDPRFMSEVFQAFAEMMQPKSRATLSYRPQANGQQERSVKTVIQPVRVYAKDPLQQDWDEIVERLVFAINTSMDKP
ncbi:unnamed protein product [Phytophthora fragariaefolia]|uniref:Unnamed protein product n=1 Tax=Phytophthora fragariaefolia TaxID=1490495 RepID=A0A9W6YPY8_9STRA|nr:unnamed protein product [Phytophthora fragariaefolia]